MKCEYMIAMRDSPDAPRYHRKCGKAGAQLLTLAGMLTSVEVTLCVTHAFMADQHCFVSSRGYAFGKIDEYLKADGYRQQRFPGTGITTFDAPIAEFAIPFPVPPERGECDAQTR